MAEKVFDNKSILIKQKNLIRHTSYHRSFGIETPFHVQEMVIQGGTGVMNNFMVVIFGYSHYGPSTDADRYVNSYQEYQKQGFVVNAEMTKQTAEYICTVMTKNVIPVQSVPPMYQKPDGTPSPVGEAIKTVAEKPASKPEPTPETPIEPLPPESPKEPEQPAVEAKKEDDVLLPECVSAFLDDPNRKENTHEVTLTDEQSKSLTKYKDLISAKYKLTARFVYLSKNENGSVYRLRVK